EALAALHEAGWLHGQVRPEHIVVSPQGQATLIDLTEARQLETAECDAGEMPARAAAHAAPESFSPRGRVTVASDIYSLGVLLYESLARRPFEAADVRQMARQHRLSLPPDIRRLSMQVSAAVAELLHRMLAKEPLRRPSAADLVRWLTELEIEAL